MVAFVQQYYGKNIKKLGHDRIVFGTNSAFHNNAYELGSLLTLDVEDDKLYLYLGQI